MSYLKDCYEALKSLPCSVTRGWPALPPPLPSLCFYRLKESRELALMKAEIGLRVRAHSPEDADRLGELALNRLLSLGYALISAVDAPEEGEGFGLEMVFEAEFDKNQKPLSPLALWLRVGAGGFAPLKGLSHFSLLPMARERQAASSLSSPAKRLLCGPLLPATLKLGGQALAADTGQGLLEGYFHSGQLFQIKLERGGESKTFSALATRWILSPLGFEAELELL